MNKSREFLRTHANLSSHTSAIEAALSLSCAKEAKHFLICSKSSLASPILLFCKHSCARASASPPFSSAAFRVAASCSASLWVQESESQDTFIQTRHTLTCTHKRFLYNMPCTVNLQRPAHQVVQRERQAIHAFARALAYTQLHIQAFHLHAFVQFACFCILLCEYGYLFTRKTERLTLSPPPPAFPCPPPPFSFSLLLSPFQ